MDFKKLGQQVGRLKQQAEEKLGDRAEPENLKRDGKQLRDIMSGDGSLAEKAKEAKAKVIDRDEVATESAPPAESDTPAGSSETPKNPTGDKHEKQDETGR